MTPVLKVTVLRRVVVHILLAVTILTTGSVVAVASILQNIPSPVATDEPIEGAISVLTRFRFPEDLRGGDFGGVYLAGLASSPQGAPDALAVAWTEQSSGWFRNWGIQLVSDGTLLKDDPRANTGSGVLNGKRYLVLSAVDAPQPGHEYETLLTYDSNSGTVSVWIEDLTEGATVYSGPLEVGPIEQALYATAGPLNKSGAFTPSKEVKAFRYVIPRTLSWDVVRTVPDGISQIPGSHLNRMDADLALQLRLPGHATGEVRLRVEQGDSYAELLRADVSGQRAVLPLDARSVFAGKSSLVLEYWHGTDLLFTDRKEIRAGHVEVKMGPGLSMVSTPTGTELVGSLQVTTDGPLPAFDVRLVYQLRAASKATPLNDGWYTSVGGVDVPVEAGVIQAEVPFRLQVSRSMEHLSQGQVFVTITPHVRSSIDIPLTHAGLGEFVIGERNVPFPKVGEYQVLRGDFHIHTTLSDGELAPRERTWESYMYGYDAIAITDHRWTTSGYDHSIDLADSIGLIMIRGFETGIDEREHFVVLDIDTEYVLHDEHHWAIEPGTSRVYYQDKVRDIIAHGGFIHYAHPGSIYVAPPTYQHPDREYGWTEEVAWMIDQGYLGGVEVKAAYEAPRRDAAFRWALEYGLTLLETSDIHKPRDFNNTSQAPVTLLLVTEKTDRGVMEALREGRTLIWRSTQLRGKEEWLVPFFDAIVDAEVVDSDGTPYVEIRNLSGLTLHGLASVGTGGRERIALAPNGGVRIAVSGEADSLNIRWTNVWSAPSQLFESTHSFER